ncbi:hypothetical protein KY285_023629 [Solanum tuberosum]|nr:hypothetical protein KY289_023961 [Solanum tuberosum]KAH0675828.1 hypothetical protein KY285_023629 [Solanum tuberosum]
MQLQELIRKELDIHVGKTAVRRARTRVLQESMVKNDLDLGEGHELTLITDMQKGLEIAVADLLPLVEHRMCARHVFVNWCKNWKGIKRRNVFWKIAKSTFKAELRDYIKAMKKLGRDCLDGLLYYNVEMWCKRYFKEHSKCDSVDNNMAEIFNAWILSARYKTIITMLEEIRIKMMKRIGQLKEFSNTWPMNNMNMWPPSDNPTVQPPAVKQLPGKPSKARRKEANETKRTGCPIPPTVPTQTATTSTQPQARTNNENGRGRGRAKVLKEARRTPSNASRKRQGKKQCQVVELLTLVQEFQGGLMKLPEILAINHVLE